MNNVYMFVCFYVCVNNVILSYIKYTLNEGKVVNGKCKGFDAVKRSLKHVAHV